MSGHQDYLKRKYQEFVDSILKESPFECDFKVGDIVTYTNEFGVSFENREIIGFAEEKFQDRFIYLDGYQSAYWFPNGTWELEKQK